MNEEFVYVYGVVRADTDLPAVMTVEDCVAPLEPVVHDGLEAVVSRVPEAKVRMTRVNLEAHQGVVEALLDRGTVLPMRFGVVAEARAVAEQLLSPQHSDLERLLREFDGLVEMTVEARFHAEIALREAVASVPRIRRLQAIVSGRPAEAAYYERLALGQLVVDTVNRIKEQESARLGEQLAATALRARRLRVTDEDVVFKGAFLLGRPSLPRFEELLAGLAEREQARMSFRLVGPLAPWDFVELGAGRPGGEDHGARSRSRPVARSWAS